MGCHRQAPSVRMMPLEEKMREAEERKSDVQKREPSQGQ